MKKLGQVIFCVFALLLTGCTDYSYTKAVKDPDRAILLSETDSRMLLSQQINDAIATKSGIESQLVVYLQDTVKPTAEMKDSLKETIKTSKLKIDEIKAKTEAYHVAEKLVATQKTIVQLMGSLSNELDIMSEALNENDFEQLVLTKSNYSHYLSQLQAIVL